MRRWMKPALWISATFIAVWIAKMVDAKAQTDKLKVEKTQRDLEQQRNFYKNMMATALLTSAGSSSSEVLTCDSDIDQYEVDALISRGQPFGGKRPAGCKPAEIAEALRLADGNQSRLFSEKELSELHRASLGFRKKSVDGRGTISVEMLGSVSPQAVQTCGNAIESIQFVSSDSDHQPNRQAEFAQIFYAKLPNLDCLKDAVKVAQTCGSNQRTLTSAALCLAHQYGVDEKLQTVFTSLQAAFLRAAVVLTAAEIEDDALARAG